VPPKSETTVEHEAGGKFMTFRELVEFVDKGKADGVPPDSVLWIRNKATWRGPLLTRIRTMTASAKTKA
jgi:hypothetical protein